MPWKVTVSTVRAPVLLTEIAPGATAESVFTCVLSVSSPATAAALLPI